MQKTILTMLLVWSSLLLVAQNPPKHCGMDDIANSIQQYTPDKWASMQQNETYTQDWIAKNWKQWQQEKLDVVYTIPVVVHVVWSTSNPASNISDERIQSQLDVLAASFRAQNDVSGVASEFTDVVADMEVEFCLAQRNPEGLATTGINRVESSLDQFESNIGFNPVKSTADGGADPWPVDQYLNIWVCNGLDDGVLGFADPPGAPFDNTPGSASGLAIDYRYFGTIGALPPYNGGATAIHEIGHFLNLNHPWGLGNDDATCAQDDLVNDTPRTSTPNYGCSSTSNQCDDTDYGADVDLPDNYQNFMDYEDDVCALMFTIGQKARTIAALAPGGYRSALTSNPILCQSFGFNDAAILNLVNPSPTGNCTSFEPVIEVINYGASPLIYAEFTFSVDGVEYPNPVIYLPEGSVGQGETVQVTLPFVTVNEDGIVHNISVSLNNLNFSGDDDESNNTLEAIFATAASGLETPFAEDFEGTFPPSYQIGFSSVEWETEGSGTAFDKYDGTGNTGGASVFVENFNTSTNTAAYSEFIAPDLRLLGSDNLLTFYTAYALTSDSGEGDILEVLFSSDCGESFNPIYSVSGNDLVSADATDNSFVPQDNQWKQHTVDLSDYGYLRNAAVLFRQTRGDGNNLYIDDVGLNKEVTGIETPNSLATALNIFPNPAHNNTLVQFESPVSGQAQVQIVDKTGRVMTSQKVKCYQGQNQINLDLAQLAKGMYFVKIYQDNMVYTKKLMVL